MNFTFVLVFCEITTFISRLLSFNDLFWHYEYKLEETKNERKTCKLIACNNKRTFYLEYLKAGFSEGSSWEWPWSPWAWTTGGPEIPTKYCLLQIQKTKFSVFLPPSMAKIKMTTDRDIKDRILNVISIFFSCVLKLLFFFLRPRQLTRWRHWKKSQSDEQLLCLLSIAQHSKLNSRNLLQGYGTSSRTTNLI